MDKDDISNSCDDASHSSLISQDSQQSSPRPSIYSNGDLLNKPVCNNDQLLKNQQFTNPFTILPQEKYFRTYNYQTKASINTPIQLSKPFKDLSVYSNQMNDGGFVKAAFYDTISPLRRPSEAEQKVDELTEKIEKEMNLIGQQLQKNYTGNLSENTFNLDLLKQKSPPPYYGYHHTNTPSKKVTSSNDFQHFPVFSKNSNSEPRQLPAHMNHASSLLHEDSDDLKKNAAYQQYLLQKFNHKHSSLGTCVKCIREITSVLSACQAVGEIYHKDCFTCFSCGRPLKDKPFYHLKGRIYCEEDYLYSGFQQTSEKCVLCGHLIIENILQAMGNSYHPRCFKCHLCQLCLDGVPFTIDVHNHVYCIRDYHSLYAPKCASCHLSIVPTHESGVTIRVVSMEKDYHVECYKCFDCNGKLTNDSAGLCYPLNGVLLCKLCHLQRIT